MLVLVFIQQIVQAIQLLASALPVHHGAAGCRDPEEWTLRRED